MCGFELLPWRRQCLGAAASKASPQLLTCSSCVRSASGVDALRAPFAGLPTIRGVTGATVVGLDYTASELVKVEIGTNLDYHVSSMFLLGIHCWWTVLHLVGVPVQPAAGSGAFRCHARMRSLIFPCPTQACCPTSSRRRLAAARLMRCPWKHSASHLPFPPPPRPPACCSGACYMSGATSNR